MALAVNVGASLSLGTAKDWAVSPAINSRARIASAPLMVLNATATLYL